MAVYVVTVAGVTKQLQPGWSITETANGRNSLSCQITSSDGSYRPAIGANVILTEDGTRIFAGLVDRATEVGIGGIGRSPITTALEVADYNLFADRRYVTLDIPPGTLKQALTALVPFLTRFGVTLHPSQGDNPLDLPLLSYRQRLFRDILNELSDVTGGQIWNINYDKQLRMVPPVFNPAPFSITDSDRTAEGDISVEVTRGDFVTFVTLVCGGTGQEIKQQIFTADGLPHGGTTRYVTDYPSETAGTYWPNTVILNGITVGPSGFRFNAAFEWYWDPPTHAFVHNDAFGLTPAGTTITVNYMAQYPFTVTADGGGDPADFSERTYEAPDIRDKTVAQSVANSYLGRDMATPKTVRYRTAAVGLHPGQLQNITKTARNLTGSFLLTDVEVRSVDAKTVRRSVTAVAGSRLSETWRSVVQNWNTGGGGTSAPIITAATLGSGGSGGAVGWIDWDANQVQVGRLLPLGFRYVREVLPDTGETRYSIIAQENGIDTGLIARAIKGE